MTPFTFGPAGKDLLYTPPEVAVSAGVALVILIVIVVDVIRSR